MISYDGLYEQLNRKGIRKTDLTAEIGISSRTIAKIAKGERLSNKTLQKIADYLGVRLLIFAEKNLKTQFYRSCGKRKKPKSQAAFIMSFR